MKNQLEQLGQEGGGLDDSWGDKDWLWNTGGHVNPQMEFNWLEEKKKEIWHISAANTHQHGRFIFRKSETVRKINLKEVLEV